MNKIEKLRTYVNRLKEIVAYFELILPQDTRYNLNKIVEAIDACVKELEN
jgi:hypothetical protein